jgi:hypothetical protein
VKYAGALVALALCSACGGALRQAQDDMGVAPSTAALNGGSIGKTLSVNGRLVTAAHANLSALPRYAAILPDRRAKSSTFEYIINDYGTYASIFDYPKSDKQIGTIKHVGGQGCTNVLYGYGKNTFWIQLRHGYQRRPCGREFDQRRHRDLQGRERLGHRHDHAVE